MRSAASKTMLQTAKSPFKLIECPRDAWQGLPKPIPAEVKADYLRLLIAAGFKHIDAVSFVSSAAVPQMADSEQVLKYLDAGIQEALLKDELVVRAREGERKDCKGSSVTHPSDPCKKALRRLTDVIILAVKKGIALPVPERRPEWKK